MDIIVRTVNFIFGLIAVLLILSAATTKETTFLFAGVGVFILTFVLNFIMKLYYYDLTF